MKRFLVISLVLAAVVSLSACDGFIKRMPNDGNDLNNEDGLANPFKHYDSIEEINKKAGVDLEVPAGFNTKDVAYSTIQNDPLIAECSFNIGEQMYSFRAAKTTGDITGIKADGKLLGDSFETGTEVAPVKVESGQQTDEFFARWFAGSVQYILYSLNATEEEFNSVYEAVHK